MRRLALAYSLLKILAPAARFACWRIYPFPGTIRLKSALMKPLRSRAVEQNTLSSPLRMAIRRFRLQGVTGNAREVKRLNAI
jgi:hypothetical protein